MVNKGNVLYLVYSGGSLVTCDRSPWNSVYKKPMPEKELNFWLSPSWNTPKSFFWVPTCESRLCTMTVLLKRAIVNLPIRLNGNLNLLRVVRRVYWGPRIRILAMLCRVMLVTEVRLDYICNTGWSTRSADLQAVVPDH